MIPAKQGFSHNISKSCSNALDTHLPLPSASATVNKDTCFFSNPSITVKLINSKINVINLLSRSTEDNSVTIQLNSVQVLFSSDIVRAVKSVILLNIKDLLTSIKQEKATIKSTL